MSETTFNEDPLQRRQREQEERKSSSKTAVIILAVVAAILAGAAAYLWWSGREEKATYDALVGELNTDKSNLEDHVKAVQDSLGLLHSDYADVNAQLDSSRMEVELLLEKLQSTQATDRAKMRQYEKELGKLRSIMRSYIVQIDSLNTLNHKLTEDAVTARKERDESNKKNVELTAQVQNLSGRVAAGSVIKARGLSIVAMNEKGKKQERAKNVAKFYTTISLVANELAPTGPMVVYLRVKGPDGSLLTNGDSIGFSCAGESYTASASRRIDYTGEEVELGIYLNGLSGLEGGTYTAEFYTEQGFLGKTEVTIK